MPSAIGRLSARRDAGAVERAASIKLQILRFDLYQEQNCACVARAMVMVMRWRWSGAPLRLGDRAAMP